MVSFLRLKPLRQGISGGLTPEMAGVAPARYKARVLFFFFFPELNRSKLFPPPHLSLKQQNRFTTYSFWQVMQKIYGKALFIALPVYGLFSKPTPGEEPRRVASRGSGRGMALSTQTSRNSYWKNTREADTETC